MYDLFFSFNAFVQNVYQVRNHQLPDRTIKGTIRAHIKAVMQVLIVLKKDQRTGTLSESIMIIYECTCTSPWDESSFTRWVDWPGAKNILDEFNAFYAAVCNACIAF